MTDHDCPHAVTLRNLGVWFPNCPPDTDPEIVADCVAVILNEERARNGGTEGAVEVAGIPAPQWLTPETLANLKRSASGEGTAPPPDEDHGVRLVHFGCDECKQVGRVVTKLGPECLHCDLPRGHAGDCVPMVWPQPGTTPRIKPVHIDTPDDERGTAPQVPAEEDGALSILRRLAVTDEYVEWSIEMAPSGTLQWVRTDRDSRSWEYFEPLSEAEQTAWHRVAADGDRG